ncbi:MAG: type II toxin-antitoxin system RelE/ParE family toxin [Deltaproteobacteria bacterium]|nr:type II toxin-antitoxin system RelE/ParE family toxin [Deltaproteobacteria bacterium]
MEELRDRIAAGCEREPFPLAVRPRAEVDLDEAFGWYEAQRPGLGEAFLRSARACFARMARHPEAHPEVQRRVRRASLQRFPCGVFYVVREDRIDGLADAAKWGSGADPGPLIRSGDDRPETILVLGV